MSKRKVLAVRDNRLFVREYERAYYQLNEFGDLVVRTYDAEDKVVATYHRDTWEYAEYVWREDE